MKQFFLLLLLLFPVIFLYGQEEEQESNAFNYELELSKLVSVPNSPEAEAFAKYGNTQVNMYSGTPDISIPIYVFKGREIDLPVSLTYDASGIKVEQLATQVGLGWNFNAGGRISRIVNGNPDDFQSAFDAYLSFMTNDHVQQKTLEYINENQTFTDGKMKPFSAILILSTVILVMPLLPICWTNALNSTPLKVIRLWEKCTRVTNLNILIPMVSPPGPPWARIT